MLVSNDFTSGPRVVNFHITFNDSDAGIDNSTPQLLICEQGRVLWLNNSCRNINSARVPSKAPVRLQAQVQLPELAPTDTWILGVIQCCSDFNLAQDYSPQLLAKADCPASKR